MRPSTRPANSASTLVLASALILILTVAAPATEADIWKFVDSNGVVNLSDRPMGPGSELLVRGKKRVKKASVSSKNAVARLKDNEKRYTRLIDRVSRELSLDRNLIHAVVRVESAFDPQAVSRAGAVGLMQLMPGTAKRYGVRDSRNPTQNVYAGVLHLRKLIQRFDDVVLALAAYNAGENAVINYGYEVPPYPETQDYVRKVLTFYRHYSGRSSTS
jgi:soluble lytic murein transglycosylase-like protein